LLIDERFFAAFDFLWTKIAKKCLFQKVIQMLFGIYHG